MTAEEWRVIDKNLTAFLAIRSYFKVTTNAYGYVMVGMERIRLTKEEFLLLTAKEPEVLETDDENHS